MNLSRRGFITAVVAFAAAIRRPHHHRARYDDAVYDNAVYA